MRTIGRDTDNKLLVALSQEEERAFRELAITILGDDSDIAIMFGETRVVLPHGWLVDMLKAIGWYANNIRLLERASEDLAYFAECMRALQPGAHEVVSTDTTPWREG